MSAGGQAVDWQQSLGQVGLGGWAGQAGKQEVIDSSREVIDSSRAYSQHCAPEE